ncbi:hypothetical protein ACFWPV_08445 [Streptomyces uncialis]|uniref:hypothetical protein n=1 Tax=Streptomyces uncialis TaxID=1048205 RepID=UPI00365EE999
MAGKNNSGTGAVPRPKRRILPPEYKLGIVTGCGGALKNEKGAVLRRERRVRLAPVLGGGQVLDPGQVEHGAVVADLPPLVEERGDPQVVQLIDPCLGACRTRWW